MTTAIQHASFAIDRAYKAPPARVFAAFSDEQAHYRWFVSGEGWAAKEYRHDFRVGGHERSRFEGAQMPGLFGNDTWYLDIVAPQNGNGRIVFAYNMSRDGVTFSSSLATIDLIAEGSGTRLVFHEQAAFFEDADGPEMRKDGWTELLAALDRELSQT